MRIRQKKTYGLSVQANSLIVPDGATEKLENVLHQRDGLYIKERGFKSLYDPSETIYGCFEFDQYIVVVLNSQIIRIDKFGNVQGSKTSSDEPFEIDGTLRPGPYSFTNAPFSEIMNDQAFFCTPEGIRVMRDSSLNNSELPGLDAPTIASTADLTTTLRNYYDGEGSQTIYRPISATTSIVKPFYANDLLLTVAQNNATPVENYDVEADTAISYKAVLRRVLDNGQTIESEPSAPVFAYNNVIKQVYWGTDNANSLAITPAPKANDIFLFFWYKIGAPSSGATNPFSNGDVFTGTIVDCVSNQYDSGTVIETIDSPEINGRYNFEVVYPGAVPTGVVTLPGDGDYAVSYFKVTLAEPPNVNELQSSPFSLNSSGTLSFALDRFSSLDIRVPDSAKDGDYIDLYYSKTEIPLSSNPLAIPDGDYYLAKEIKLSGSGPYTVTTDFSDGIFQKGPALYTNPSDGDRSRQPNIPPPGANCIESWKGHMFYGNTYRRHRIDLTHIGGNLSANRTLSLQFTDSVSPENFTFPFIQANADAPTIKKRTMELAKTICSTSSNFLCYFSGGNIEFPGGLTFISRIPNRAFKVFVNNSDLGNSMEPVVGTSFAATEVVSTQEAKRNRVYWSKLNQPESVPYFTDIGNEDEDILNIQRTRESLIVVKRDGMFSLYGDPSRGVLSVREIDTTVKGVSSTGVTRLGNRVYAKTNQGIVAISETSMSLVSRNQIEPLVKVSEENTTGDTVMYGLEDDRQLYVATATSPSDPTKTVYSYNTITQSWSEISKVFTWGFVIDNNFTVSKTFQNNRVITDGTEILIERKDNELTDFSDTETAYTVSAVSGDVVTLSSSFSGPVGSVLLWNNGSADKLYRVTAVDGADVTLNIPFSGSVSDPVTMYTPIRSTIRTSPIDGGDSSYVKQFTKFIMNLRYDAFSSAEITFRSDWLEYGLVADWTKRDERRGWGQQQWGRFPWGQATASDLQYLTKPSQIVQTEVPRTQQKTTFLQAEIVHNVACEGMFIQQMAFELDTRSKRPAR